MSLQKLACGTVLNFSSLSYLAQLAWQLFCSAPMLKINKVISWLGCGVPWRCISWFRISYCVFRIAYFGSFCLIRISDQRPTLWNDSQNQIINHLRIKYHITQSMRCMYSHVCERLFVCHWGPPVSLSTRTKPYLRRKDTRDSCLRHSTHSQFNVQSAESLSYYAPNTRNYGTSPWKWSRTRCHPPSIQC